MKKHALAKLRLDRETLSPLSADTLVRIHGGQDAGERRLTPDCSLPPTFRNCNSRIVCNA